MKKKETTFKERALRDLNDLPLCFAEKIQQVAKRGTPDILACINGRFVAIELKRDKKAKVDMLQKYKLLKIAEAGGLGIVVWPEVWGEALDMIRSELIGANAPKETNH